jgi:hypothetical protein
VLGRAQCAKEKIGRFLRRTEFGSDARNGFVHVFQAPSNAATLCVAKVSPLDLGRDLRATHD